MAKSSDSSAVGRKGEPAPPPSAVSACDDFMVDFVVLPLDVDGGIGTSTFVVRRVAIGGSGLIGE